MEISKQVCSLELAKKLKELGCKQDSILYWAGMLETPDNLIARIDRNKFVYTYSAFTVAELGEMLPRRTQYYRAEVTADVMEGRGNWYCHADVYLGPGKGHHTESADTEADARGLMLCYLLENKLVSVVD